jgi:hypothetical protein
MASTTSSHHTSQNTDLMYIQFKETKLHMSGFHVRDMNCILKKKIYYLASEIVVLFVCGCVCSFLSSSLSELLCGSRV